MLKTVQSMGPARTRKSTTNNKKKKKHLGEGEAGEAEDAAGAEQAMAFAEHARNVGVAQDIQHVGRHHHIHTPRSQPASEATRVPARQLLHPRPWRETF